MNDSVQMPTGGHIFEKSTIIQTTVEKMVAFHDDPAVFGKLVPPPVFIRVHEDNRTSLTAGDLKFTLWFGPLPIRWHAQHQPGPTETSFADLMVDGPMAYWRHEHIFKETVRGVKLTDSVTLAHKPGLRGLLTRLLFGDVALRALFFYRHLRTRIAIGD